MDVVVVDKHDYHTFQPLLYQVATALLEPSAVGHPLRDLFHEQPNARVHIDTVTGIDLAGREVQFAEMDAVDLRLPRARARRRGQLLRRRRRPRARLPDVHARRRRPPQGARARQSGRRPTRTRRCRGRRAPRRRRRRRPDRGRERRRARRAVRGATSPRTTRICPPSRHASRSSRPRRTSSGCSRRSSATYTKKTLEERGVEVLLGEIVESVEPTRVTLKSGTVLDAHTLVWGAGLQANPISRPRSASSSSGGTASPPSRISASQAIRRCSRSATSPGSPTRRPTKCCPSSARSRSRRATVRARTSPGSSAGKETEPFRYHDKGTMATIGRGAAVVQLPRGRTLKGEVALLAWGAVHLALLSTGEDRAKSIVDWTWAGIHARACRPHLRRGVDRRLREDVHGPRDHEPEDRERDHRLHRPSRSWPTARAASRRWG